MSVVLTERETRERARALLGRTRELFERTHWTQGAFYKNKGKARFCAIGGIRYFYVGDPLGGLLEEQVADWRANEVGFRLGVEVENAVELDEGWPDDVGDEYYVAVVALAAGMHGLEYLEGDPDPLDLEEKIYEWNDEEGRRLEDVLDAFRKAEGFAMDVRL